MFALIFAFVLLLVLELLLLTLEIEFLFAAVIVPYIDIASPTNDEIFATFDGKIRVLFVFANLLNAPTYCSAT